MSMAQDIAEVRWAIQQLGSTEGLSDQLDGIQNKLKYDIEPKLDKALEGKIATEAAPQHTPDELLLAIRYAIIYATTDRKLEAIKELRKITNAGLAEAKTTAEWITARMD